jgi:hypothetical protein
VNIETNVLIGIVAQGMQRKCPREEIIKRLEESGTPSTLSKNIFLRIEHGLKAGVAAALSDDYSKLKQAREKDELFASAFEEGIRAFRKQLLLIWLKRLVFPFAIVTSIGIFLWFYLRK